MQEGPRRGGGLATRVARPLLSGHLPPEPQRPHRLGMVAFEGLSVASGLMALELGPHWRPRQELASARSRGSDRAREITQSSWSHTELSGQGQGGEAPVMSWELVGLRVGAGEQAQACS